MNGLGCAGARWKKRCSSSGGSGGWSTRSRTRSSVGRGKPKPFWPKPFLLKTICYWCAVWSFVCTVFLLHPSQTTRHASQRIVSSPHSRRIVSGHPWSTSQGCTGSVAILFFLVAVASYETREAAGSQMATRAGRVKHESQRGVGGSTFQGAEIREGIEALGDNDSGAGQSLTSAQRARRARQE